MKILSYGSLNTDYVYSVEHFVSEGETIAATTRETHAGGKALNQCTAASLAGAEVFLAGKIGYDGNFLTDFLRQKGVDCSYITKENCPGGHTVIQVTPQGKNSIIYFAGANALITESEILQTLSNFDCGDIILLQNEVNNISFIINEAKKRGMKIVFNPSPVTPELFSYPLNNVNMFILNEHEGALIARLDSSSITSEKDIEAGLAGLYPDAEFILTLGDKGAVYFYSGKRYFQPAVKVNAVDTTGAGDTFSGYFIALLSKGISIPKALFTATAAAALAIQQEGAAEAIPTMAQVRSFTEV